MHLHCCIRNHTIFMSNIPAFLVSFSPLFPCICWQILVFKKQPLPYQMFLLFLFLFHFLYSLQLLPNHSDQETMILFSMYCGVVLHKFISSFPCSLQVSHSLWISGTYCGRTSMRSTKQ